LKITYLYQYFGTPAGSWSTRVYELTKRWVEAGHEVTVITAPYPKSDIRTNKFIDTQYFDGIKVIIINSGDNNLLPTWRRALRAIVFALTSTIIHLCTKSEVAIASSGPITIGIPALMGKILARKKYVFEVRDLWPDGAIEMGLIKGNWVVQLSRWFEKTVYNKSSMIVTASVGQTTHIQKRFPKRRYLTIPNACDISLFNTVNTSQAKAPFPTDKPFFLHLGSLGFIHNCSYIISAAEVLKNRGFDKEVNIVFIGDGSERHNLERRVTDSNLSNVFFTGLLPKNQLPSILSKAKATLFTTLDNPVQDTCSPNKVFDSFAAGVPIIQTTRGWIKDLVNESNCGLNVDPQKPETMAEAIMMLITNPDKTMQLGLNAKRLASEQFDRDKLAKLYLKNLVQLTTK
jgi:glycosyltransferase involved in cell wall biosynthesis